MNIAFDSHKRYTLSSVADHRGEVVEEVRIDHGRGAIVDYLSTFWILTKKEPYRDPAGKQSVPTGV